MILVISENEKCYSSLFYKYLLDKHINALFIKPETLIKNQIVDCLNEKNGFWSLSDKKIEIQKIVGVYHSFEYFNLNNFHDFSYTDQEYVREEWFAYMVYFLSQINKIINPLKHTRYSGTRFSIPGCYKLAKQLDFNIPEYEVGEHISKCPSENHKNIYYNSLFNSYKHASNSDHRKNSILRIRKPNGTPQLTHLIGETVLNTLLFSNEKKEGLVDNTWNNKCKTLARHLGVNALEILSFVDNNCVTFYGCTIFPNWKLSHLSLGNVFEKITDYFLS